MSELLEAAKKYSALGFSVIPLRPREKIPALSQWNAYRKRRPSEEEMNTWFAAGEHNLGIVCGEVSGNLQVIDFDSMEAARYCIPDLEALAAQTLVVRTGKGYHVYLRLKGGVPSKATTLRHMNDRQRAYLPVDVKAEGGYVVAPPSIHPSGARYAQVGSASGIVESDGGFLRKLRERAKEWPMVEVILPGWKEGVRHGVVLGFAAFLRKTVGYAEAQAIDIVEGVCRAAEDVEIGDRVQCVRDTYTRPLEGVASELYLGEMYSSLFAVLPTPTNSTKNDSVGPGTPAPSPVVASSPSESGAILFQEVREVIDEHVRLESPWASAIAALFVMQSYITPLLPSVFYLMIGGRFGHGKTKLLRLLMRLTGGTAFENVSVAALARSLKNGATIGIDEYDVVRERDVQEVRDALVRQGYQADAAPYVRYDAAKKQVESFPVFGPKVITFRGGVEDALQSRGYIITMGEVEGEDGYSLVLRNMFPRLRQVPERLQVWGRQMATDWTPGKVQEIMENGMTEDVKRAVQVLGANRDSELATAACAEARVVGVDLGTELRKASEARGIAISASQDEDLELMRLVVLEAAAETVQASIEGGDYSLRIKQTEARKRIDEARKSRGDRRLTNAAFASLRREAGIQDGWLSNTGGSLFWLLPQIYLAGLRDASPNPTHPTYPTLPHMEESGVGGVSGVGDASPLWDEDAVDCVRLAVLHAPPGATSEEIASPIARDLGFSIDEVRGKVTAIRQAIEDGKVQR